MPNNNSISFAAESKLTTLSAGQQPKITQEMKQKKNSMIKFKHIMLSILAGLMILLVSACSSETPQVSTPDNEPTAINGQATAVIQQEEDESDESDALYNRALALMGQGDSDAAIAHFSQAIKLRPDLAKAYHQRGFAYALQANLESAIADYNQAITLDPNFTEAYHNRGMAKLGRQQATEALEDFNRALELNPDFSDAYYNRGNTHYLLGNHAAALADFRRHLELAPPSEETKMLEEWVNELAAEVEGS